MGMADYPHKELTYAIIGACMEVYNDKGFGFLESVYQECLEIELSLRKINFRSQSPLTLCYKGRELKNSYIPDLVFEDSVILEIKAARDLVDEHRAQILNYLRAAQIKIGLLVNFGKPGNLQWERIIL